MVVLGIGSQNRQSILAIEPGSKDDASSWGSVFRELIKRGLNPNAVRIGVMDGLPGLENKFKEHFTKAETARCWVHALKNTMAKVPQRLKEPFKLLGHKMHIPRCSRGRCGRRGTRFSRHGR